MGTSRYCIVELWSNRERLKCCCDTVLLTRNDRYGVWTEWNAHIYKYVNVYNNDIYTETNAPSESVHSIWNNILRVLWTNILDAQSWNNDTLTIHIFQPIVYLCVCLLASQYALDIQNIIKIFNSDSTINSEMYRKCGWFFIRLVALDVPT